MSFEIAPEQLPVISANQTSIVASLTTAMTAAAAQCLPVPAAVDVVSGMSSNAFMAFQQAFFAPTSMGVTHLLQGAEALVRVSADYVIGDASGGAAVAGAASTLPK